MSIKAMKQALGALGYYNSGDDYFPASASKAITALRTAIEQAEKQELVAHAVVAGCLYDFMGWLTSRRTRITLSDRDNASPAVDAIVDFSKMRGLKLDDALVESWQTALATTPQPKREWIGLTDEEMAACWAQSKGDIHLRLTPFASAIEAKLKEKNNVD